MGQSLSGIVRSVSHIGPDPEDRKRIFFLPGKFNIGPEMPGLAYRIESVSHAVGAQPRLAFEPDPIDTNADTAFGESQSNSGSNRGRPAAKRSAATDWLRQFLASGPMPAERVFLEGEGAGFSRKTLRSAREEVGITPFKTGFSSCWMWQLPTPESPPEGDGPLSSPEIGASWESSGEETQKPQGNPKMPNSEELRASSTIPTTATKGASSASADVRTEEKESAPEAEASPPAGKKKRRVAYRPNSNRGIPGTEGGGK